jgi:putative acetyltransferase
MVVLREIEPADVPSVVAHVRAVLAEFGLTFGDGAATDAQVTGLPGSYAEHGGRFWGAFEGEQLLGTAGVFPIDAQTFELRKMYLAPDARGKGVGKQLLAEAEAFARARGATRMVLDTHHRMTRAMAFYEANGFVRDDAWCRASRCDRGYVKVL